MNYLILTFIMKKTFVLFFLFFVLNNVYSNKITLYNSLNNKIGIIIYNTFGDFTIENILPNNSIILESKNILYIETYSRFKIKYFFINLPFFIESQNYNTYFNQKIFINEKNNISTY